MKLEQLCQSRVLLLDGATGTNLMERGMPDGVCTESWVLEHPAVLQRLQQEFASAGSQVLYTASFGANRARLQRFGLQDKVREYNLRLVDITRRAVPDALVAGDVSPTGLFIEPFGASSFEEVYDIYFEQISALKEAGVDMLVAETMMNLSDARAAVLAGVACGLPVLASVTVDADGHSLSGMGFAQAVLALQAAGAGAVGLNCSAGPVGMAGFLRQGTPYAQVPIAAKPNAGEPGQPLAPQPFAAYAAQLVGSGARLLGGCCQSTPQHIEALHAALAAVPYIEFIPAAEETLPLCTENRLFQLEKPMLSAPVACDENFEDNLLDADNGEVTMVLAELTQEAQLSDFACAYFMSALPVAIHACDEWLLEKALRLYQGRAAVQCDNAAQLAVARRYGAAVLQ